MGYYEAMARRGQKIESEELSKAGRKKSLWGSIGRTAGTLGVMAISFIASSSPTLNFFPMLSPNRENLVNLFRP